MFQLFKQEHCHVGEGSGQSLGHGLLLGGVFTLCNCLFGRVFTISLRRSVASVLWLGSCGPGFCPSAGQHGKYPSMR